MNIKKEIELFKVLVKMQVMIRMDNIIAFSLLAFGLVVRIFVFILFFKSIFVHVSEIGGWSYNEVLALQGVYLFIDAVAWGSYSRGFRWIYWFVENGELDVFLTKPIDVRFHFICRFIDVFFTIPQAFVAIGIIIYGAGFNLETLYLLPQFIVLLICAFVIHYSVIVIITSINFFYIVPYTTYFYNYNQVSRLGQYPIQIYKGVFRLIFSIIIPLAFIFSIPAQSLFSQNLLYLFTSPVVAVVFYFISKFIWEYGIKRYESARG